MRSILRIAFFWLCFCVFSVRIFVVGVRWRGGCHVLVCGDMDPARLGHFLPEWYTYRYPLECISFCSIRYGLRYHYLFMFRPIRPGLDVLSACWPILRPESSFA